MLFFDTELHRYLFALNVFKMNVKSEYHNKHKY